MYGDDNSYTAEFWQYDPRIGRRWNVDPLAYENQSPYAAFNNNPIYFNDPLGLTPGDTAKTGQRRGNLGETRDQDILTSQQTLGEVVVDGKYSPEQTTRNTPTTETKTSSYSQVNSSYNPKTIGSLLGFKGDPLRLPSPKPFIPRTVPGPRTGPGGKRSS